MKTSFDVIVVGAGHAGIEAATAAARLGCQTALITNDVSKVGAMSCNPAIGGLAKGHMVREIDVLGGEMGKATDESCIQFKRLNSKKGPAVRGSRAQCDKDLYSNRMLKVLKKYNNLSLLEGEIFKLVIEKDTCKGVVLTDESKIFSSSTIITTGTFLNGRIHIGLESFSGGRMGDKATGGISEQLNSFGFSVRRLKTGTPPRLLKDSIDWSKTEPQYGDDVFFPFSYKSSESLCLPQIACFLSYTNSQTHEIINENLKKSPLFQGIVTGTGPRYCPSIEDKVTRFSEKNRHQTFLEPEGIGSNSIYLQGISTSLPQNVQEKFLRTIPGLERVELIRPGYAVEYDFVEPTQIFHTLETRNIKRLFLAGQINGTSGYEEAAGQGLVAGTNAANKVLGKEKFILQRDESYIGVLIDDLVIKGTKEPYRMFTSRAEHRLVLREDNTIDRLLERGRRQGLVNDHNYRRGILIVEERNKLKKYLDSIALVPREDTQNKLKEIGTTPLTKPTTLSTLLRRPEVNFKDLQIFGVRTDISPSIFEPVEIDLIYSGYIKRQQELINQAKKMEELVLPENIDFTKIRGLSSEETEKLVKIKPQTLGQASRISGVNPSAIQALLIHIKSIEFKNRKNRLFHVEH